MSNPFDQFDQAPAQASGNPFDQFDQQAPQQADPQLGNPQQLTFAEKYIAPILDKTGLGNLVGGNVRGSAVGRVAQGLADPGVAIAQGVGNLVGQGDAVNQAVQNEEQQYQAARAQAGSTGFDPARLAGNIGMTSFIGAVAPGSLPEQLGSFGKGVVAGAGYGLLQPVTDGGNYFAQKGKQAAVGGATGGATSLLGSLLARVVSPKASVNPDLQLLQNEGVSPTVGQALGGWANTAEQKLQSLPIVGDAIGNARRVARADFNQAAINRAVAPIGETVKGSGQAAVAEAGNKLSQAYDDALAGVTHVNFDTPEFNQSLGQLQQMATGLTDPMQKKFNDTLSQVVLRKMSPNGSILGPDLKAVDSELGQMASRYSRSSVASEQELGDALLQLKSNLMGQVKQAYPQVADALNAADTGWANLVRVERAATGAVNSGGVFTPAQLGTAVRGADQSVRDRATARGAALMQDLASAGQRVIGNNVPDSGTVGRAIMGAGILGSSALVNPAIPLGLVGGAAAYTRPIQNALVALVAKRPDMAPVVANYLRQLTVPASAVTVPMLEQRFQ